ncbi:Alpha/Beta hydrolase protein [Colletotrichum phormii]|uniref:Alpha/Beta hydrolase protein n=1 Tax=Colletotrichum phormii TaxID=359342 RepID=A0AAI9ZQK3_9PEZI|nr:Alpha/Beta hydrolase protein [Colletotrichum phormii]KAK1636387.1 Alpha/Beta hydrolase protein [Colletotrichum phormii]
MKISASSTAAALAFASTKLASAQNLSFGADNFYRSDIVTVQPITFPTQNHFTVAGNLFIRNNSSRSLYAPAIVVGHPMGAIKEQSANLYATKLAEQGFVTVSIDTPFWGGSEGEPRNAVSPDLYAEAFSAAVDYLGLQDFVDRERIGGLGICGSGSFVISAAKIDPRLKAIATASMYDMGAAARDGLRHTVSVKQRKEIIATAAAQRWVEAAGGEIEYTGGTPNQLTNASTAVDREFYDFYRTQRGEFTPENTTANLTTHPTLSSNTKFMNFYPFNDIETISPRPLLFISGDQAHSREFSEDAYARAAEPKELLWVPGAGHVDLYDRVELIPFDKLTQFFRTNLVANGTSLRVQ